MAQQFRLGKITTCRVEATVLLAHVFKMSALDSTYAGERNGMAPVDLSRNLVPVVGVVGEGSTKKLFIHSTDSSEIKQVNEMST